MNRQRLLQQMVTVELVILFLSGCSAPIPSATSTPAPTPTPTPIPATPTPIAISQQDSQKLIKEWGLVQLMSAYGSIAWDKNGKITVGGDLELDFAFENPPKMTLVEEASQKYFKFNAPMPKGNSTATVILAASEVKGATIKIPRFASTPTSSEDPKVTCVSAKQFHDYNGTYDFKICMTLEGRSVWVVDMNVFYDGSEHHIYGEVEFFGVRFTNNSKEPLVFKIDSDKYVYVKGNGTAKTKDGASVQFGK